MTDRFAVVHTNSTRDAGGLGTGVQSISSSDIQGEDVQWAILFIYGASADGSNSDHARVSIVFMSFSDGVKANARNRCSAYRAVDAQPNVTDCIDIGSSTLGMSLSAGTSSTSSGRCIFDSRITNGFKIEWTEAPGADYRITAIFGGGHAGVFADIDVATTGGASITSPGFAPSFVFASTHLGSYTNPFSGTINCNPSFGFAVNDGTPSQRCIYAHLDDGVSTTDADANVSTSRMGGGAVGAVTPVERHWRISAFGASGFTATATIANCNFAYLAIKLTDSGIPVRVADESLPGSGGVTAFTGLGILPQLVIHAENLLTGVDSFTDGAGASVFGLGAFTANAEGAGSMRQQEGFGLAGGGTDTDATSYANSKSIALTNHLGAVASEAALSSMNSSGFSLNFSTATAGRMVCFAIGVGSLTLVQSETVTISDGAAMLLSQSLVVGETVTISDGAILVEQEAGTDDGDYRGKTYQGGASYGGTVQGGADLGHTSS